MEISSSMPQQVEQQFCLQNEDRLVDCKHLGSGITLNLKIDKPSYKIGEFPGYVTITWSITNMGTRNVTLFRYGVTFVVINSTGSVIWSNDIDLLNEYKPEKGASMGFMRYIDVRLAPGESSAYDHLWGMRKADLECIKQRPININCNWHSGKVVAPGEYELRMHIWIYFPEVRADREVLEYGDYLKVKFQVLPPDTNDLNG